MVKQPEVHYSTVRRIAHNWNTLNMPIFLGVQIPENLSPRSKCALLRETKQKTKKEKATHKGKSCIQALHPQMQNKESDALM